MDGGGNIQFRGSGGIAGECVFEHEEGCRDACLAERNSLRHVGHGKTLDARFDKRPRHLYGAMAVGVAFHDRDNFAAFSEDSPNGRDVPCEPIQGYFDPGIQVTGDGVGRRGKR